MPIYHKERTEGRTVQQRRLRVQKLRRVSIEVLGVVPALVDIFSADLPPQSRATGGMLWLDRG